MKTLGKILLVLAILVVIVVVISLFLPRKIHVERAKLIEAPVHVVFNQVNNLQKWEKWSPWHKIDTAMEVTYFGKKSGEGSGYEWKSEHKQVGSGKLTITASELFDSIATEMDFMEQGTASGYYLFEETDSGTNVLWAFDTDMGGNPLAKLMGLMMDKMIGADFEKGLNNLNELCKTLPEYCIKEKEINAKLYIGIKDKCLNTEIGEKMGQLYGELHTFMSESGIEAACSPLAVYYSYDDKETEFEVGIPVEEVPELTGNIKKREIPAGKYLATVHYGPYEELVKAYEAIQKYMEENEKVMAGNPWEKYVTDPEKEANPKKWITKIYFPVQ